MVELEADWPIHFVRIHPSRDRAPAKPSTPDLSLSPDGDQWVVVPSGEREAADPLVVRLPARHGGRFVKLELPVTGQLSFSRIEVMVECRHAAMLRVAQRNDFVFVYLTSLRMRRSVKPYFLRNVPAGFDGTIGALHLNALQGRFGNNVQKIGTAVCLARHLGLDRLYLGKLPLLDIESPVAFDSLTVMPDSELERDRPQAVLCGTFYYKEVFGPAFGALDYRQIAAAARVVARPIFERQAARSAFIPAATDLAIHLRAGDIFAHKNPHPDYVQPPLAFYQMCVGFAQSELGIKRLVLVYQDEGNPCVGALKAWLDQTGLPYVVQSGTLPDDLAVLLAAQHCIFGRGTFGHAIAILSRNMRTVFHSWLAPDFAKLSEVCGGADNRRRRRREGLYAGRQLAQRARAAANDARLSAGESAAAARPIAGSPRRYRETIGSSG